MVTAIVAFCAVFILVVVVMAVTVFEFAVVLVGTTQHDAIPLVTTRHVASGQRHS